MDNIQDPADLQEQHHNSVPTSPIPKHLTEFYNVSNSNVNSPAENKTANTPIYHERVRSRNLEDYRQDSRRLSFMSASGSTIGTIGTADFRQVAEQHPDIPALLTHGEVLKTSKAYDQLIGASKKYRKALETCAEAAAEMGSALDGCASCPGSVEDGLQNAAGLYLLIANQQSVLARCMANGFEQTVQQTVGEFSQTAREFETQFRMDLRVKSRALQQHETQIRRMSKRVHRTTNDLAMYRNSLLDLTAKIDDIDRLKYTHFQDAYRLANDTSQKVFSSVASSVRAHLEISEALARKGWSGGGLEEMVAQGSDPFVGPEDENEDETRGGGGPGDDLNGSNGDTQHSNGPPNSTNLFSVLPTKSILPYRDEGSDDEEEDGVEQNQGRQEETQQETQEEGRQEEEHQAGNS